MIFSGIWAKISWSILFFFFFLFHFCAPCGTDWGHLGVIRLWMGWLGGSETALLICVMLRGNSLKAELFCECQPECLYVAFPGWQSQGSRTLRECSQRPRWKLESFFWCSCRRHASSFLPYSIVANESQDQSGFKERVLPKYMNTERYSLLGPSYSCMERRIKGSPRLFEYTCLSLSGGGEEVWPSF